MIMIKRRIQGLTEAEWWQRIRSDEAEGWPRNIGHDKGWTCSAYVFLIYDVPQDILLAVYELDLSQLIEEKEVKELMEVNDLFRYPFKKCTDPPDSPKVTANMNFYSREHKAGIRFVVLGQDVGDKKDKDVLWGIGSVRKYIQTGRFVILGTRCPRLVQNLQTYKLKESNAELGPDKTQGDDHFPDALRYGVVGMRFDIKNARAEYERKLAEAEKTQEPRYPEVILPVPEKAKEEEEGLMLGEGQITFRWGG